MANTTQPNIVLLLTDDHAQWASHCYGNSGINSPAMDWLSSNGVRMDNSMTITPVCSPARASFWTGLYPSQHGIHDYLGGGAYRDGPWIESETQLGELLSTAGYRCGFFGKWHCGTPEVTRPGFEEWFSIGRRTGPHNRLQRYIHNGEEYYESGYQSRITTDAALRFIRNACGGPENEPVSDGNAWRRPGSSGSSSAETGVSPAQPESPFFAFIGMVATHSPYADHPPRLVERHAGSQFPDIPSEQIYPFGRPTGEGRNAAAADRRTLQQQYYAAVEEIDEQVGRVIDMLDELGILENTLIVYTSDHGLNVGHHGLFGKGNATRPLNMLEESIRIPMIFGGWSELFPGQRRSEFVDHTDLFATLLEVAGAKTKAFRADDSEASVGKEHSSRHTGRSFLPALTRAAALSGWKDIQFGEYGDVRMAHSHTHKLILRHGRAPDQLFDLIADPRETRNIIEDPAYSHIVSSLTEAIETHFARFAESPVNGLRVASLRSHNEVEAWRGEVS